MRERNVLNGNFYRERKMKFATMRVAAGKSVADNTTVIYNDRITGSLETMKIVNALPKLDIALVEGPAK